MKKQRQQILLSLAQCRTLYEEYFGEQLPDSLPYHLAAQKVREKAGEGQFLSLTSDLNRDGSHKLKPGFKFLHYDEPYGNKYLIDCEYHLYDWSDYSGKGTDEYMRHRIEAGLGYVIGTVEKGGTTSRLFQYSHFKDLTGEKWTVPCVSRDDLERGFKRTVAM